MTLDVEIADGETVIELVGDRDAAVVVKSASGERIYLPPEDFERPAGPQSDSPYQAARGDSPYQPAESDSPYQSAESDSPYQSAREDSPYQSAPRSDSPYQSSRVQSPEEGLRGTRDGFVIRHPEPVTDLRLLR